jgi:hypothetical protein
MRGNQYIKPGTLVLRKNTLSWDEEGCIPTEIGRVIHCWDDGDQGDWDCYIAFFGYGEVAPTTAEKPDKPYVLRYWSGSLEIVDEETVTYSEFDGVFDELSKTNPVEPGYVSQGGPECGPDEVAE